MTHSQWYRRRRRCGGRARGTRQVCRSRLQWRPRQTRPKGCTGCTRRTRPPSHIEENRPTRIKSHVCYITCYISIVYVCLLSHMMEDIEISLKWAGESTRPASSPLLSCLMGHFLLWSENIFANNVAERAAPADINRELRTARDTFAPSPIIVIVIAMSNEKCSCNVYTVQ